MTSKRPRPSGTACPLGAQFNFGIYLLITIAQRVLTEPGALVGELNENFLCEGIRIEIENSNGNIAVRVIDTFAGMEVVV